MTTLEEITAAIVRFRDERDWAQFHTPRNLGAAIAIEAAELQQSLLWKSDQEVHDFLRTEKGMDEVGREVADTLIFCLLLCHDIDIDPIEVIERKLEENARKYPVELARGNAAKYTKLTHKQGD